MVTMMMIGLNKNTRKIVCVDLINFGVLFFIFLLKEEEEEFV